MCSFMFMRVSVVFGTGLPGLLLLGRIAVLCT